MSELDKDIHVMCFEYYKGIMSNNETAYFFIIRLEFTMGFFFT